MAYLIRGSAVGHPRATGATAPSADTSGYLVKGSSVARPCPDGATMPAADLSGHLVTGRGWWRAPCDEATECDCSDPLYDDFEREEAEGFGISTPTGVLYTSTDADNFSVSDGVGHFHTGGGDQVNFTMRLDSYCAWQQTGGFIETYDFRVDDVDSAPSFRIRMTRRGALGPFWNAEMRVGTFNGYLRIESDPGFAEVDKFDWVPATWYTVKLEYRPHEVMRLRVWPTADSEPGTWDVELTDTDVAGPLRGGIEWTFSSSLPRDVDVDNVTFDCALAGG